MKTNVIIIGALMLIGISMSSCSNEDLTQEENKVENLEQEKELLNLQNQISELNTSTFGNSMYARGFGKWFRKVFGIVLSDAVGGIFGSLAGPGGTIVGATLASGGVAISGATPEFIARTAVTSNPLEMNEESIALNNVVLKRNTNELPTLSDSIGYYHNKVLIDMNNKGQLVATKDIKSLCNEVYLNTNNILGYEIPLDEYEKIANNKEIVSLIENSSENFADYEDMDKYLNNLRLAYPNLSSKFSVVREFMRGLANLNIDENDGNYAQKVLELINNSNLYENSKEQLRNAVIIGNASYQLWTVE